MSHHGRIAAHFFGSKKITRVHRLRTCVSVLSKRSINIWLLNRRYAVKAPVAKPRPVSVAGMNDVVKEEEEGEASGVGLNRRASVSVASTAAPAIAPRLNRSALLRSQSQGLSFFWCLVYGGVKVN